MIDLEPGDMVWTTSLLNADVKIHGRFLEYRRTPEGASIVVLSLTDNPGATVTRPAEQVFREEP